METVEDVEEDAMDAHVVSNCSKIIIKNISQHHDTFIFANPQECLLIIIYWGGFGGWGKK